MRRSTKDYVLLRSMKKEEHSLYVDERLNRKITLLKRLKKSTNLYSKGIYMFLIY